MDLRLPDMDGRAAAGVLRSDPATAAIFVAAVTASAMRGDREELLGDGFDAYFAKPIDAHGFVDELTSLLAARPPSGRPGDSAG
jgi:CheY-like chemotaxis protein